MLAMVARLFRALCLVPALALACSESPDSSDSSSEAEIPAEIDAYADQIDELYASTCECWMGAGYQSPMDCSDALGSVEPAERKCLADALEGVESEAFLACMTDAYSEAVDCLDANAAAGCGQDGLLACVDASLEARDACTQVPNSVRDAFMGCTA